MTTKPPHPTHPPRSDLADLWPLDPGVVFLNHGSYGACLRTVLDAQRAHRDRMEAEPVAFFARGMHEGLDRSRGAIAGLLGGEAEDYVFVPNATTGVATILDNAARGLGMPTRRPLQPGDEVLALTHEYPACKHNLRRIAERSGASVRTIPMPLPPDGSAADPGSGDSEDRALDADALVEAIMGAVTARTRLALLSQITSPSGVVVPIERVAPMLEEAGVCVVVDGAHGPGAVPFDVPSLGAPFYTANCHKWLGAPKGAAIVWVRRDLQAEFRPLVLSNDAEAASGRGGRSKFNTEFDHVGTADPTAWLSVADAIEALPNATGLDWPGIMAANRTLALRARDLLCEAVGVRAPVADELLGPMAMVPLPRMDVGARTAHAERPTAYADPLQDALVERHGVQVPVWRSSSFAGGPFDGRRFVRVSAQRYNTEAQYAYLGEALAAELERESAGARAAAGC